MYCENCGTKIADGAEFCQDCGRKINASSTTHISVDKETPISIKNGDVFYSEEWRRKKVFAIASMPYFDVIADKQNLSLIKFQ